ncbi:hypothetical protein RJ639_009390 [Escallonia herrerae]|uniref:Aminotransferase-like plant mobile domain-containing protein n=1 Tax=Escallonia herrerae TaxID=1293975 RepID=A0AA88VT66_9ASTE|nr:hypothetical protein RJ639_009390 [Escallonia herrerae]
MAIFEEREDLMVSPTGGSPTLRRAHFLIPTVNSINGPKLKLPSLSLSPDTKLPLKVYFNGWRRPLRNWNTWVQKMHPKHQFVWKEAGVYEAIMGTTYSIRRNDDLVFGLAERWCSDTNTFMFPWGEATITLEDMIVLGGFCVLGGPVSMPLQTKEMVDIEDKLSKARLEVTRSKKKAQESFWLSHLMDSGSEIEHEAFLSLWLSRFVFHRHVRGTINKDVFSIAVHLSRGTRITLAPFVLATLYRDLSLLKETLAASAEFDYESENSILVLNLWAPLKLVQVWAWERFPLLQPKPNFINTGEVRLARWHSVKSFKIKNVSEVIDSSGESFKWRPYAIAVDNWLRPRFYKEEEHLITCNLGLDEELESFARCLRVCALVGKDFKEPYLPHRVGMQFGMDQDIPGWFPGSTGSPETAWGSYSRPFGDVELYIPPRLFESDITMRYLDWWENSILTPQDAIKGVVRRKRSTRRSKRRLPILESVKGGNDADVPPGFPPKRQRVDAVLQIGDNLPILPVLSACNGPTMTKAAIGISKTASEHANSGKHGISTQTISIHHNEEESSNSFKVPKLEVVGATTDHANETKAGISIGNMVGNNHNGEEGIRSLKNEMPKLEIDCRISKLERKVAALKATIFSTGV